MFILTLTFCPCLDVTSVNNENKEDIPRKLILWQLVWMNDWVQKLLVEEKYFYITFLKNPALFLSYVTNNSSKLIAFLH